MGRLLHRAAIRDNRGLSSVSRSKSISAGPGGIAPEGGRRYSLILMGGHICVDIAQGGIAAALPFLVLEGGYSYTEVTMLVFAANIASAIIQPLFGWLGDRKARPWLMALGVLFAGCGMAALGVVQSYWLVVASAMLSGTGIAMLHPEGGRLANLVAKGSKEGSMSIFSLGGQIGFTVGPIITVAALTAFGLKGTLVFLIPTIPYAILLFAMNGRFASFGLFDAKTAAQEGETDNWGHFAAVLGTLSVRSVLYYSVTSFAPLFMVYVLGQTEQLGSLMVTLFAAMGAVATILSSIAAKKIGTVRLTVTCFSALVVAFALFAANIHIAITIAMIVVLAFGLNIFNPPAITLGQSFVPHHLGMASGLSFGVAVCVGGVLAPCLGKLGDVVGLIPVMWVVTALAAVGLALSLVVARICRKTGKGGK